MGSGFAALGQDLIFFAGYATDGKGYNLTIIPVLNLYGGDDCLFYFIQLVLHEKGFFRYKSTVLHGGEGAIITIRWKSCYIAWANDMVSTVQFVSINTFKKT